MKKTLKDFIKNIKKKEELPVMQTVFGKHSEAPKDESKKDSEELPVMQTVFGKHSEDKGLKKKVNETLEEAFKPGSIKDPIRQTEAHTKRVQDSIHRHNDAPKNPYIKSYASGSFTLNRFLHSHHTGKEDPFIDQGAIDSDKPKIKELDDHFHQHAHFDRNTHVFTGLHRETIDHIQDHVKNNPDKVVKYHHPAFLSATTDFRATKSFGPKVKHEHEIVKNRRSSGELNDSVGKHVLKLHLRKGDKAMSIKSQSRYDYENEVLLHRGHDIEIHPKPTIHYDGTHIWHGRIIGHNPKKIED